MSAGLRVGHGQCGDLYHPDNAKASSVTSGSDGMPNVTAFDSSSFRQLAQIIDLLFITLICHDPVAVQSGVRSIFRFFHRTPDWSLLLTERPRGACGSVRSA